MSTRRHPLQAFSLAVLVEIILLIATGIILGKAAVKKTVSDPVVITLQNEEKQPEKQPEKLPEPKPPEPKPLPKPKVIPPKAQPKTPPPPQVTPPPLAQAVPAEQVSTAFTQPAPPPPAPPPPAPDASKARESDIYAAKVHAAVQEAHFYPPAAAAMRYTGRVRVEFHLRDGIPGESHLVVPSGIGIIDRAALNAVQIARYPAPPKELRGVDIVYQVWVQFSRQ